MTAGMLMASFGAINTKSNFDLTDYERPGEAYVKGFHAAKKPKRFASD